MAKKSLYLFLTSLLGVMLFLILDRIVVFIYFYLIGGGYISGNFNYSSFVAWDYLTLTIVLLLGAWYGLWLGLGWFSQVYEQRTHGGFIDHVAEHYWPGRKEKNIRVKISEVKKKLEKDLWKLEDLSEAKVIEQVRLKPVARKVIRKRVAKKIK